jgi:6-phosphogluconate dehydrogenase
MIHNGIEYGDMQIICESYQLMRDLIGLSVHEIHDIFDDWNKGDLNSYLIEITRNIMAVKDDDGSYVLEKILDTAGQKGTGKWAVISAANEGTPLTLISEAVFARCLSSVKEERIAATNIFQREIPEYLGDKVAFIDDLGKALYASKIISYAQGYSLMMAAAQSHGWSLNYGDIAMLWRGGCIIRSKFLSRIKEAYEENENLKNLLMAPYFSSKIKMLLPAWRRVVSTAVSFGIPVPAFCSALSYFDGFTCEKLSSNLLQAQRDYFGAHTYERNDAQRGEFFHTDWLRADINAIEDVRPE